MNTDERRSDFNTKARSENAPHLSKARSNDGALVLPPEERFFTKPELAKVMKVSVRCITDMMRRGEIRYLKINGHLVRFRLQDVNQRLSETVLFCEGTGGSETRRHGDAETRRSNSNAQRSTLNAQHRSDGGGGHRRAADDSTRAACAPRGAECQQAAGSTLNGALGEHALPI